MAETWKHYAKPKKPITSRSHTLLTYLFFVKGCKYIETESVYQYLPGAGAIGRIGSDCICDYKKCSRIRYHWWLHEYIIIWIYN